MTPPRSHPLMEIPPHIWAEIEKLEKYTKRLLALLKTQQS